MSGDPADVCAIFDLDGLLIDSEPLWVRAELEVFGDAGLALTAADCARTTGLRIDEVAAFWQAERPWDGPPADVLAQRVIDRMEQLLSTEALSRPGAHQAVALLQQQEVPLALASSSSHRLIAAALARLGLADAFPVVRSAEDQPLGKPHPGVYLAAAEGLGADPRRCIALEDSLNGVIAAAAARMGCIAVPDGQQRLDPRFKLADVVLPSLADRAPRATWGQDFRYHHLSSVNGDIRSPDPSCWPEMMKSEVLTPPLTPPPGPNLRCSIV